MFKNLNPQLIPPEEFDEALSLPYESTEGSLAPTILQEIPSTTLAEEEPPPVILTARMPRETRASSSGKRRGGTPTPEVPERSKESPPKRARAQENTTAKKKAYAPKVRDIPLNHYEVPDTIIELFHNPNRHSNPNYKKALMKWSQDLLEGVIHLSPTATFEMFTEALDRSLPHAEFVQSLLTLKQNFLAAMIKSKIEIGEDCKSEINSLIQLNQCPSFAIAEIKKITAEASNILKESGELLQKLNTEVSAKILGLTQSSVTIRGLLYDTSQSLGSKIDQMTQFIKTSTGHSDNTSGTMMRGASQPPMSTSTGLSSRSPSLRSSQNHDRPMTPAETSKEAALRDAAQLDELLRAQSISKQGKRKSTKSKSPATVGEMENN